MMSNCIRLARIIIKQARAAVFACRSLFLALALFSVCTSFSRPALADQPMYVGDFDARFMTETNASRGLNRVDFYGGDSSVELPKMIFPSTISPKAGFPNGLPVQSTLHPIQIRQKQLLNESIQTPSKRNGLSKRESDVIERNRQRIMLPDIIGPDAFPRSHRLHRAVKNKILRSYSGLSSLENKQIPFGQQLHEAARPAVFGSPMTEAERQKSEIGRSYAAAKSLQVRSNGSYVLLAPRGDFPLPKLNFPPDVRNTPSPGAK